MRKGGMLKKLLVLMAVGVAFLALGHPRIQHTVFGLPPFEAADFGGTHGLEISNRGLLRTTGSMHILCSNDGKRFVYRLRLPSPGEFLRVGAEGRAIVFVRETEHKISTRFTITSTKGFHTFVSDTLLPVDLDNLASYFGDSPPYRVVVHTMEWGTTTAGSVAGDAITAFSASCRTLREPQ